jgi:hypothetical protein
MSYALFREFLCQVDQSWHSASIASFFLAIYAPGLRHIHRGRRPEGARR